LETDSRRCYNRLDAGSLLDDDKSRLVSIYSVALEARYTDYFFSVIFLLLFIARSKLVPDFAITIHVINLIVTSVYTGAVPRQLFWWGLQVASAGLMTFLGIWACRWRELKPIQFGGKGKTRTAPDASSSSGGVYEMVGMEPKDEAV